MSNFIEVTPYQTPKTKMLISVDYVVTVNIDASGKTDNVVIQLSDNSIIEVVDSYTSIVAMLRGNSDGQK